MGDTPKPKTEFNKRGCTFGLEIFRRLYQDPAMCTNAIISPVAIQIAVGFVYLVVARKQLPELSATMEIPTDPDELTELYKYVVCKYAQKGVVSVKNKIFLNTNKELPSELKTIAKKTFMMEIEIVNNIEKEQLAKKLNEWVAKNTNGLIKTPITERQLIDGNFMVLLVVVYLKCYWLYGFDNELTAKGDFNLHDGTVIQVDLMQQSLPDVKYGLVNDFNCIALEMPLSDPDLGMLFLLPNNKEDFQNMKAKLNTIDIQAMRKSLKIVSAAVVIPRFKVEASIDLAGVLEQMGLKSVFQQGYTNLFELEENQKKFVTQVIHKTVIEVNEAGIESTAATIVRNNAEKIQTAVEFIIDSPFFFSILSNRHRMFFWGCITNPNEAEHTKMANSKDRQKQRTAFNQNGMIFGRKVYQSLVKSKKCTNSVVSPVAIQVSLGILYLGSGGSTQKELAEKVELAGFGLKTDVAELYRYVLCKYRDGAVANIINRLYVDNSVKIKSNMDQKAKRKMYTVIKNIDFKDKATAVKQINGKIASKSVNSFKDIIKEEDIEDNTKMIAINAMNMQCKWKYTFQVVEKNQFWKSKNYAVEREMLTSCVGNMKLGDSKDFDCTVLEIPFINEDLGMLVLIPKQKEGVDALIQKLSSLKIIPLRGQLQPTLVSLSMPKFQFTSRLDLKEALTEIGLKEIFNEKDSNFSNLVEADGRMHLSKFIHLLHLDVNANGVGAVGKANQVKADFLSANQVKKPKGEPKEVNVDRPFVFAIMSKRHRMFYLGSCIDPQTLELVLKMETRTTSSTFNRHGIAFGMDLLRNLKTSRQNSNILISPVAIHLALGLAHMSANGTTKDEMTKVLRTYDEKLESAKAFFRVICKYKADENVLVASKIYVSQTKPCNPKFQKRAIKWFLSEVENVNFKNQSEAADKINKWVADKTKGKINPVLTPEKLNEDASMIVISAIYFKANWGQPFDKAKTTTGKFALSDAETVEVPMMSGRGPFKYAKFKSLDCVALELPFENADFSMLILLPNTITGINDLEEKLFNKDLYMYRKRLKNSDTEVVIPKFRIDSDLELSDYLKAIGMPTAFDEANADFPDLADGKTFITQVVHKTFIDVTEDGVDTNTPTKMTLPSAENPNYVSVSHPFVCAIMSKKHRLFFLATVRNPLDTQKVSEPGTSQNGDQNVQKEENNNGDKVEKNPENNLENGAKAEKQDGIQNGKGKAEDKAGKNPENNLENSAKAEKEDGIQKGKEKDKVEKNPENKLEKGAKAEKEDGIQKGKGKNPENNLENGAKAEKQDGIQKGKEKAGDKAGKNPENNLEKGAKAEKQDGIQKGKEKTGDKAGKNLEDNLEKGAKAEKEDGIQNGKGQVENEVKTGSDSKNGKKNGSANGKTNGKENDATNSAENGSKNGKQNEIKNGTKNGNNKQNGIKSADENGVENNEASDDKNDATKGNEIEETNNVITRDQKYLKNRIEDDLSHDESEIDLSENDAENQKASNAGSDAKYPGLSVSNGDKSMSDDSILSRNSEETLYF